ncbi:mast cell protease 8-like isoform X3 [Convolutriloba macropyga]|uniref:mast cell protease 8-like isoform X3 n=1 Tax=Convolutriloba macropyga TaxID=536237 RepID=UPI003F525F0B
MDAPQRIHTTGPENLYEVRFAQFGDFTKHDEPRTSIQIVSYKLNPDYVRRTEEHRAFDDIAVGKLKKPWTQPNSFIDICTPPKVKPKKESNIYTVIGMGLLNPKQPLSGARVLQEAQLEEIQKNEQICGDYRDLKPKEVCLKRLSPPPPGRGSVMPANSATSMGDSGGPVIREGKNGEKTCVYAMVTSGPSRSDGSGSLFARLSSYRDWIKNTMKLVA